MCLKEYLFQFESGRITGVQPQEGCSEEPGSGGMLDPEELF